jgi:hypothetical protein
MAVDPTVELVVRYFRPVAREDSVEVVVAEGITEEAWTLMPATAGQEDSEEVAEVPV